MSISFRTVFAGILANVASFLEMIFCCCYCGWVQRRKAKRRRNRTKSASFSFEFGSRERLKSDPLGATRMFDLEERNQLILKLIPLEFHNEGNPHPSIGCKQGDTGELLVMLTSFIQAER